MYRAVLYYDKNGMDDYVVTNTFATWEEAKSHILMVIRKYNMFYHGEIEERLPTIGWVKTENQL